MARYGSHVAKLSGLAVLALFAFGTSQASALAIWNGTSPAPNDSTSWSGLGADGATISSPFSATSTDGIAITGTLAGGSGLASVQCPALPSCSWTGGFTAGDHLVWTLNNTTGLGTAPLTLAFGKSVLAGGVEIQSDVAGAFTADVQAFDGGTSLGTVTLGSDAAGDPIFIGAQDTTADITSLVFSCTGACGNNDFCG